MPGHLALGTELTEGSWYTLRLCLNVTLQSARLSADFKQQFLKAQASSTLQFRCSPLKMVQRGPKTHLIILRLFYMRVYATVCFNLYCDCFNLFCNVCVCGFCNVWVCVCMCVGVCVYVCVCVWVL